MIPSMIVDFQMNGSNMEEIQLQEISILFQARVSGMMMMAVATGDQCLYTHMIQKEMFILELGTMIKTVIAISLESTSYSMLKIQEYSLKE